MRAIVIGIDPGNIETGYCVVYKDNYEIIGKGKCLNEVMYEEIGLCLASSPEYSNDMRIYVAVEGFKSYGMMMGQTTIDAIWWSGRFFEMYEDHDPFTLYRKEVKLNLCGMTNAKDKNVTAALVERFAPNTLNRGKGYKKSPGYFYGFKADIWAAFAICVTYVDILEGRYKVMFVNEEEVFKK